MAEGDWSQRGSCETCRGEWSETEGSNPDVFALLAVNGNYQFSASTDPKLSTCEVDLGESRSLRNNSVH